MTQAQAGLPSRIFINYRREDSARYAQSLYEMFAERFGSQGVFIDIDAIAPGIDFVNVIDEALASCTVVLAVIGPDWITTADGSGRRRLDGPDDFVRLELEAALVKPQVRVIPVLVHGASMPSADELPEPLRPLARRNAVVLTDARFRSDAQDLIHQLETVLTAAANPTPAPAPSPPPPPPPAMYPSTVPPPPPVGPYGGLVAKPRNWLPWAIVVTVLACWPLGIPAIVYASKANSAALRGDPAAARFADRARTFVIMAAVVGLVLVLIVVGVAANKSSTSSP